MNRYTLQQTFDGVKQELQAANSKLTEMYADAKTTLDARNEQKELVKDLEDRFNGLKNQLEELDREEQAKIAAQNSSNNSGENSIVNSKAALIRATMRNETISSEVKAALGDGNSTGGEKLLPKTMTKEIIHEPFVRNPLRKLSTITNETNLEVPKISFTLDDDDFINDTETAKELKAEGDTVVFGRNKFKVLVPVSETIMRGSDTNLVETVEQALKSGLAAKEKKVAFAKAPKSGEEHMSFYSSANNIKVIQAKTLYRAIRSAIADLHEDYRENAIVLMRNADYLEIVESLSTGQANYYSLKPEQVIGKPVEFCDSAVDPIIGEMRNSHFNYDGDTLYEHGKDIKTGEECFVLTGWIDHKIKLKSAFRIAKVAP